MCALCLDSICCSLVPITSTRREAVNDILI